MSEWLPESKSTYNRYVYMPGIIQTISLRFLVKKDATIFRVQNLRIFFLVFKSNNCRLFNKRCISNNSWGGYDLMIGQRINNGTMICFPSIHITASLAYTSLFPAYYSLAGRRQNRSGCQFNSKTVYLITDLWIQAAAGYLKRPCDRACPNW